MIYFNVDCVCISFFSIFYKSTKFQTILFLSFTGTSYRCTASGQSYREGKSNMLIC